MRHYQYYKAVLDLICENARMKQLSGLLTEDFRSVSDEGFQMVEKHIWAPNLIDRYSRLDDAGKLYVINKIVGILNGSRLDMKFNGFSQKSIDMLVADIIASIAVYTQSASEKRNAYNFLLVYYNPYPSDTKDMNSGKFVPSVSVMLSTMEVNVGLFSKDDFMDALSISFFKSMEYLIAKGSFNPEKQPFSTMLIKIAWPNKLKDELHSLSIKKRPEARAEFQDIPDDSEYEYPEASVYDEELSNDDKIELIAANIRKSEIPVLYAWYNWFSAKTKVSGPKAFKTMGDYLKHMDPDDDSMIRHIMKYSMPKTERKTISSYITRIRTHLLDMAKNPEIRKKLGITDYHLPKDDTSDIMRGKNIKKLMREVRAIVREIIMELGEENKGAI